MAISKNLYKEGSTLSAYLLAMAKMQRPKRKCLHPDCDGSHEPNEMTRHALKESREGHGETFHSLQELWNAVGVNPHAKN
ncbi:hypothetical protein PHSC3_000112 [Chlamydiales bacterium STE3]|nr:hypothetical protein PHSC3_000112 [Chlamydiales bacterium STE3]